MTGFVKAIGAALITLLLFGSGLTFAQDDTEQSGQSAMEDLENAYEDGQEAVAAPTDEDAAVEAGETFDTPHDSDGD